MKVACNKVGGPMECKYIAKGDSPEELAKMLGEHANKYHPEIKKQMEKMTEEENKKWMETMKTKIEE